MGSAYVLNQFGSKSYSKQLMHSKQILHNAEEIEGLVEAFQEYNSSCSSQKEGMPDAKRGCKNVLANLASMKAQGSGSGLPYKTLIILLAAGLGLVVNNDIERKGSFKASSTGMFLADIGLYERTVESWQYSLDTLAAGRDLAETYLPLAVNHKRHSGRGRKLNSLEATRWKRRTSTCQVLRTKFWFLGANHPSLPETFISGCWRTAKPGPTRLTNWPLTLPNQ